MAGRTNYWIRKANSSQLSRRRFMGGAAVAGTGAGAFALVGCGDDDDDDDEGRGPTATSVAGGDDASPSAAATEGPAASGSEKDGGHFIATGASEGFSSLDSHREVYPNVGQDLSLAYSNLVIYEDPNRGSMRGDVAKGVPEQPDDVTYVFEVHEDVTGHPSAITGDRGMTAEDVAWNINRQAQGKDFAGNDAIFYRQAGIYEFVEAAEAVDATRVKVTLKAPTAPWLIAMGDDKNSLLFPEVAEAIEPRLADPDPELIVGTGPYIYSQFEPGKRMAASRFDGYFRKALGEDIQHFDEIVFENLGTDTNATTAAFQQKQIDTLSVTNDEVLRTLLDETGIEGALESPNPNTNWTIAYNYQQGPLANPMIRQAIDLAIDRQQALQLLYRGIGRVQPPVPWAYTDWALDPEEMGTIPGFRSGADREADVAEARALWEAGGGPEVGEIKIWVTGIGSEVALEQVEWLPRMINEALGTDQIKGELLPIASVLNHLNSPDFDTLSVGFTQWNAPDPRGRFLDGYTELGGTNFGKHNNPEPIALIQQSLGEFDVEAAIELVKEAQRLILADGGGGKWQMAGGVDRFLHWPYLHLQRSFIGYTGINLQHGWIDPNDASFEGRPSL